MALRAIGGRLDRVWYPPAWTRHVTVALVWPAIICFYAAYSPGRIKTALKHPMLVGTKLWALAHLISNGDLGSIILFGSILGWAVFDRISLKRRTDPGAPPIPVGGIAEGHHGGRRRDVDLSGARISVPPLRDRGAGVLEIAQQRQGPKP